MLRRSGNVRTAVRTAETVADRHCNMAPAIILHEITVSATVFGRKFVLDLIVFGSDFLARAAWVLWAGRSGRDLNLEQQCCKSITPQLNKQSRRRNLVTQQVTPIYSALESTHAGWHRTMSRTCMYVHTYIVCMCVCVCVCVCMYVGRSCCTHVCMYVCNVMYAWPSVCTGM